MSQPRRTAARRGFTAFRFLAEPAVAVALVLAAVPAAAEHLPDRIPLPDGSQPEGIAIRGESFYTGSLLDGTIYVGDVSGGDVDVLVAPHAGRIAVGMKVHRGLLYVAGGDRGKAYIYDASTGETVRAYRFDPGGFVNDVIVTDDAAWFTDSFAPFLYRVPISSDGTPAPRSEVDVVPLTGDIQFVEGFNVNGIEATEDGGTLVVVQSNTGLLFSVDPSSGETSQIDLGGETVNAGDGLLLRQPILWVVQNTNVLTKIRLDEDLAAGKVVRRITDPDFDVPTTVARRAHALYVVNARFGTQPTPQTDYWIAVIERPGQIRSRQPV